MQQRLAIVCLGRNLYAVLSATGKIILTGTFSDCYDSIHSN